MTLDVARIRDIEKD